MAAKQLLPNPNSIQILTPSLLSLPSIHKSQSKFLSLPWGYGQRRVKMRMCRCLLRETVFELSSADAANPVFMVGDVGSSLVGGYSPVSYYTSLGLFVISVHGLWSLIKRSVKSKIVRKSFVGEEEKALNQIVEEILSFFTRNNFVVSDRGETIMFEGIMVPSRGQAALLTFCTCISLASVGLVLTITYPGEDDVCGGQKKAVIEFFHLHPCLGLQGYNLLILLSAPSSLASSSSLPSSSSPTSSEAPVPESDVKCAISLIFESKCICLSIASSNSCINKVSLHPSSDICQCTEDKIQVHKASSEACIRYFATVNGTTHTWIFSTKSATQTFLIVAARRFASSLE